jgi:hypothetical protein
LVLGAAAVGPALAEEEEVGKLIFLLRRHWQRDLTLPQSHQPGPQEQAVTVALHQTRPLQDHQLLLLKAVAEEEEVRLVLLVVLAVVALAALVVARQADQIQTLVAEAQ